MKSSANYSTAAYKLLLSTLRAFGLVLFLIWYSNSAQGFFGLSARKSFDEELLRSQTAKNWTRREFNRQLCHLLPLASRQRRICRRGSGLAITLLEATRLSATECRRQFEYERWNCPLDSTRTVMLKKVFRETSFLYALSSASLVHALARSCSSGMLSDCTCDTVSDEQENRRTWMWGGCGDNLRHGTKFTLRFLRAERRNLNQDLRATVDKHNSRVGIKIVNELVTRTCKCHGVSGSCSLKTCWRKLSPFTETASKLKIRYDQAIRARLSNEARDSLKQQRRQLKERRNSDAWKRRRQRFRQAPIHALRMRPTKRPNLTRRTSEQLGANNDQLVYLENSPNFCNRSRYTQGTTGRSCIKGTNCDSVCCGRGYNVELETIHYKCNCKVVVCCEVKCLNCSITKEVYRCK